MKIGKIAIMTLTLLVTVTLLSGCSQEQPQQAVVQLTPVEVSKVVKGDIKLTYAATGQLKPIKEVAVIPEIPGKVEMVSKDLGETVTEGEVLFALEKKGLYQQIEQLDAQLRQQLMQAETVMKQAKLQYDNAKADYEKNQALYESEAISKQLLDGMKQKYELAEVQYNSTSDQYALLQNKAEKSVIAAQKDAVVQNIQDASIKSPITGVVAAKNIEVGQMASQQAPAYTIVNIDRVVVETSVTEKMINKIAKGQEVIVSVKALGDKEFKGVIDALSPAVTGQNIGYPVKINIDNPEHELKPGMFTEITFVTDTRENTLLIPLEAVLTSNDISYVYVLDGNVVNRVEVETGFKDDKHYEIIHGLTEGQQVVTKGQHFVVDKEEVQLVGGVQ